MGFFASRNAKITVSDAIINNVGSPDRCLEAFVAKSWPVVMRVASGSQSSGQNYTLQAQATTTVSSPVRQNEVVIGENKPVKAGEMFTLPTKLTESSNFQITFTPTSSGRDRSPVEQQLSVSQHSTR